MKIEIISGTTCSGKTTASIELAEKIDAEIISCDSVQFYRGMDIGSAKATPEEQARVKHHLIDVADVGEIFDVAMYVEHAKKALSEIKSRKKNVVVVGGSGFYLKAWFCAVVDKMEIPQDIKNFAENIEKNGAEALACELLKIDPNAANSLDINNPRRTRNALERCLASGKSVKELLEDFSKLPCPFGEIERNLTILDRPDTEMLERITLRTKQMLEQGIVEETKRLLELGLEKNPAAANSTGYKQTISFIKNKETDLKKLEAEIILQTMSLVRKQRKNLRSLFKNIK